MARILGRSGTSTSVRGLSSKPGYVDAFGRAFPVVVSWPSQKDPGRYAVTKNEADRIVFRVPTLRNVGRTAPYDYIRAPRLPPSTERTPPPRPDRGQRGQ